MATPKLNPSRSIAVIPSDYCNIPNPALYIYDVSPFESNTSTFKVCSINLIDLGVKIGDIIYDYDSQIGATITNISYSNVGPIDCPSYTLITINQEVSVTVGGTIYIYNGEDDSTGCVLYVGNGGDIHAVTEGGDDVIFANVPTASFFPVQVTKINSTDTIAYNILALR